MSGLVRSSFKLTSSCSFLNTFRQTIKPDSAKQRLYSTFWKTCMKPTESNVPKTAALWNKSSCIVNQYSTNDANDLVEFLDQEIQAEQSLQKNKTIPSKIDDFEVKLNGSEVTLKKTTADETIEIGFNVSNSVNDDDDWSSNEESNPLRSTPDFEVSIKRGNTTLGFNCSYTTNEVTGTDDELPGDAFAINEVTLYEGEWKDTNYTVSGSILDTSLYDLLMNFLEEKGITNELVIKMSDLSSNYEHSSYISLLRDMKKFVSS